MKANHDTIFDNKKIEISYKILYGVNCMSLDKILESRTSLYVGGLICSLIGGIFFAHR